MNEEEELCVGKIQKLKCRGTEINKPVTLYQKFNPCHHQKMNIHSQGKKNNSEF